jgi:DNA-binding NtrC family response regulator
MPTLLIVDDDAETVRLMEELLSGAGRQILSARAPGPALDVLRERNVDVLVSDINLNAGRSGLDLLRAVRADGKATRVVLISGFGTLETAVDAVRNGAFDYISKPFNIAEVKAVVERALSASAAPPAPAPTVEVPAGLIGRSAPMLLVYKQVAQAADAHVPVLITGESGTGKELVARAIHRHSRRSARPFVPVNCGALTETLLESELFGHTRGSFTGATSDTRGLFEQAQGGTVFLDEIGDTSPAFQVKLLRVLQEFEVRPVGGTRPVRIDVRVLGATNVDLEEAVAAGRFRQDLYYRLGVLIIRVPSLRDRREDIPLLIDRFLQAACGRAGRTVTLAPSALERLIAHDWPGNVRELENTIERLVVTARGHEITADDVPVLGRRDAKERSGLEGRMFDGLPTLDELERRYLLHVLDAVNGNRTRAAEALGVDRRTLYRMAERFGISLPEAAGVDSDRAKDVV